MCYGVCLSQGIHCITNGKFVHLATCSRLVEGTEPTCLALSERKIQPVIQCGWKGKPNAAPVDDCKFTMKDTVTFISDGIEQFTGRAPDWQSAGSNVTSQLRNQAMLFTSHCL